MHTIFIDYNNTIASANSLRKNAKEFIEKAKKMADKVCILSNDKRYTIESGLKHFGILELFDGIYDDQLYNDKKNDLKDSDNFVLLDDAANLSTGWYKKFHVLGKLNHAQMINFPEDCRKSIAEYINSHHYIQVSQYYNISLPNEYSDIMGYIPEIKRRFELQASGK